MRGSPMGKRIDLISVPTKLGPKMQALSEQQRRFVMAMIETGGNRVRSGLMAGYGENSPDQDSRYRAAAMAGSRLARDEDVIAAVQEQAERMMKVGAIKAAGVMIELLDSADPKVRLKAASETLGISNISPTTKHEVAVTHENRTQRELLNFIQQAAKDQGLDPRRLLGAAGVDPNILDAEFEEVNVRSSEGLEDLL